MNQTKHSFSRFGSLCILETNWSTKAHFFSIKEHISAVHFQISSDLYGGVEVWGVSNKILVMERLTILSHTRVCLFLFLPGQPSHATCGIFGYRKFVNKSYTKFGLIEWLSSSPVPLGSIPDLPAGSCKEIERSEGAGMVSGKHWVYSSAAAGRVTLVDCDVDLIDGKRLGAIHLNFIVWLAYQIMLPSYLVGRDMSRARFSKVPRTFRARKASC